MGETGVVPVGGELVAISLTMPMTSAGNRGVPLKFIMQSTPNLTEGSDEAATKTPTDRIRSQYDTTNVKAIMGRFYDAVSWRNE